MEKLSLMLKGLYHYQNMTIANRQCLLAMPCEKVNLATLRKSQKQLQRYTEAEIVFCFDALNGYTKEKLLESGIPFVIADKEIYLPFVGTYLNMTSARQQKPAFRNNKFSPATQRLILQAIEEHWQQATVREAAEHLCVSQMTVSRAFDEIEVAELPFIVEKGRTRSFVGEADPMTIWEKALPFLQTPVKKAYYLQQSIQNKLPLGGMSALCHYTMLADNSYPTYAATAQQARDLALNTLPCVPAGETPAAVVQVVGYQIVPEAEKQAIDPLSAILSITEEDKEEPRVEQAVRQLLEDVLHGNRN